ncbi:MAG: hypothetical protein LC118_17470 [Dehalococcoidia bacterium]|nr:hypothetical protein [Dehalococcoidia bacterium]
MYAVAYAGGNPFGETPIQIEDAEHGFAVFGPISKDAARELAAQLQAAADFADDLADAPTA